MQNKIVLSNGFEIPDFCFGTDITFLHSRGLRRKLSELKCLVKILINRDRRIALKTYYLPRILKYSMENGCNMFDTSRAYNESEYTLGMVLGGVNIQEIHFI